MQASKEVVETAETPIYCCFQGKPINSASIGVLALQNSLPEHDLKLVKEWRDNNKGLLRTLADFSYPNALWKEEFMKCNRILSVHGINNKSKSSFIFELLSKKYFIQMSGPHHKVGNIKSQHKKYEQNLDGKALNELGKIITFQTVSRFAYYLRYAEEYENNVFNHFHIPPTYLLALDDALQSQNYDDSNCFCIQSERLHNPVAVRENKHLIAETTLSSLKELLVAIRAIGLWDLQANLLIDENKNLCVSDIEQPNNEYPSNFFHRDPYLYSHQILHGFVQVFNLFEGNNEYQRIVKDFVRKMEPLYHESKQRELELMLLSD